MSTNAFYTIQQLNKPPFNIPFEQKSEAIYVSAELLAGKLSRDFKFPVSIVPKRIKNREGEIFYYEITFDLLGFYTKEFEKNKQTLKKPEKIEEEKRRIIEEKTGRKWEEICNMLESLSQEFPHLWFKKDTDKSYLKSDMNEGVSVLRKLYGKQIEQLQFLLCRYTIEGSLIFNSYNLGNCMIFASDALDKLVYDIFRRIQPPRESYIIPTGFPIEVTGPLYDAISCYNYSLGRPTTAMVRCSLENAFHIIYREATNKRPEKIPTCHNCKAPQGKRDMNFTELVDWVIENGYMKEMYRRSCQQIADFSAVGIHPSKIASGYKDITPEEADLSIRTGLVILQSLERYLVLPSSEINI